MTRETKVVSLVRPPPLPRKHSACSAEYETLAAKLGVTSHLQEVVADFLWQNDVELYDFDMVVRFLRKICPKEKRLYFRPLRGVDHRKDITIGDDGGFLYMAHWETCNVYNRTVPFEILQTVDLLISKFDSALAFFVSDFVVPNPDPFIVAMSPAMLRPIVFGVWDEPGFSLLGEK